MPGPIRAAGGVVACASGPHIQEYAAVRFALRLARRSAWPQADPRVADLVSHPARDDGALSMDSEAD